MSGVNGRFGDAIIAENERGFLAVIPDIKPRSPRDGDLLQGRDPAFVAETLEGHGAPAISVVTETKHFGGSLNLLSSIVRCVGVPVLRKDFITNNESLEETLECGADAVLLISAIMDKVTLRELFEKSLRIGLEPFVEVCSHSEMEYAAKLGATLIGINNKDIVTLEMGDGGVSRTAELASLLPDGAVLVSESGIFTANDARLALDYGARAVLVGTALWQSEDYLYKYRELRVRRDRF